MITKDIEKHVRVIADSVGQVPADLARDLDIPVIPYAVMIQGVSYLDGVDLQPDTLYQRMRVEKVIPKTSAPSPGLYIKALLDCINKGAKFILLVCVSSNLSGAYNIACKAVDLVREEHPDIDIGCSIQKPPPLPKGTLPSRLHARRKLVWTWLAYSRWPGKPRNGWESLCHLTLSNTWLSAAGSVKQPISSVI